MGLYIQEKVGTVKVTLKGPTRVLRQRKGVVAVRQCAMEYNEVKDGDEETTKT